MSEKLEPVAWVREGFLYELHGEGTHSGITTTLWLDETNPGKRHSKRVALVTLSSAASALEAKDARIAELERENAALAAHACIFTDGSGLTGDEHGNSICLVTRRATAAEAEAARLRGLLEEAEKALEPFADCAREWDGEDDSLHVFFEWDDETPAQSLPVADFRAARSIHSRIKEKGE